MISIERLRDEGFEEGYIEGFELGLEIATITITVSLLKQGFSEEDISNIVECPLERVQRMKRKMMEIMGTI